MLDCVMAGIGRFARYQHAIREWYIDLVSTDIGRKSFRYGVLGLATIPLIFSSWHRLPTGHIGVVQNVFGNFRRQIYDEGFVFCTIPFIEKAYPIRVWPVRKRLIQEFTTKDGKVIEAVVHLRLKIKVCWAQDIVQRMGVDFSRFFLEHEVSLDTESIVSQHNYDELVADDENTAEIIDKLISLTREAACFSRLELLDMTVLFRDPLDAP